MRMRRRCLPPGWYPAAEPETRRAIDAMRAGLTHVPEPELISAADKYPRACMPGKRMHPAKAVPHRNIKNAKGQGRRQSMEATEKFVIEG